MSAERFLVEIGVEELPPRALASLSRAFADGIVAGLAGRGLRHGETRSFATPRRLAVSVDNLRLQSADRAMEVFGPAAERARDDEGDWTAAARGFARKHGVAVDALEVADGGKGPRLVFRNTVAGERAVDCLPDIVDESIRGLPVSKRMRWGAGRIEFVRPVHWLVMLLGGETVDCRILGRPASNRTRGHRFHGAGELVLEHAGAYEQTLLAARVVADFEERREMVRAGVEDRARDLGARAVIDDDLLDEVTALVEWPVALAGAFDERFLRVPREALISSLKEHQKCFHVVDAAGDLLPHFIAVSNIESADPAQVVDGNERVVRPRLADADFFYTSDMKTALAERVPLLENVVFQQRLGTLADKSRRLQNLSGELAGRLGADEASARRAAELCKADLVTLMVGEFADMQGIAGRYYALNDGESPPVADALEQHYWPRFSGDRLPTNPIATCLALADRLDTLVGIFGIGQPPSGSRDPFALRRASLGVLRILVEGELPLDLRECLKLAAARYPADTLTAETVDQVMEYMVERFRAWYEDESIPAEVFRAVSAKRLSVPLDIHRRVRAVSAFAALPQAPALAAANKRVSNILNKEASEIQLPEVCEDLLTQAAEQALAEVLREKQDIVEDMISRGQYTEALSSLADLQPVVDRFFDDVMVMTEQEAVRNNRLSLLRSLRDLFLRVADISLLAIA